MSGLKGFKIVRDYLYEGETRRGEEHTFKSSVGKELNYNGGKTRCKVYDDDRILYYEAVCDGDDGAELFHDWAVADSGTVYSKIKDEGSKEWKDFIG